MADISTRVRAVFAQFNRTRLSHPCPSFRKETSVSTMMVKIIIIIIITPTTVIFLFESIVPVYKLVNYLPLRKLRVAR